MTNPFILNYRLPQSLLPTQTVVTVRIHAKKARTTAPALSDNDMLTIFQREVTETRGSLAALLAGAKNLANLPIAEPTPPVTPAPKAVRAPAGVFRSSDSTRISILNGSYNTMADDVEQDTVLVFPDYTIVTNIPRTREGARGLWESAIDPAVERGSIILEKTPFKTWNGWAADTQLECHCLMGSPLEDLQGTLEEKQEVITKELKSSASEKRALIIKTSHIGGHKFAGNVVVCSR
ncbi:hypothetical protein C0991_005998 [Blastosporella zonata]|nr:hypothetical protein C0991_005998 [Blastosporella zonata]